MLSRRYGVAVALIIGIRARYLFSPMTSDEGGYLAIARAWSNGATLYRDVWVDRPQGLLAVFALLDRVGLGNTLGLRLFAMAVCIVAAVACGQIAASLVGDGNSGDHFTAERARWLTATFVGVLTSVPQAEGFIANAELLSCTAGAVALSLALLALRESNSVSSRNAVARLFAAGVMGGVALSLKQSGFDALVVIMALLVMAAWPHRQWKSLSQNVVATAAGVSMPLAVMAVHGALTGWNRWWYAVVGYRLEQRSAIANARWTKFGQSFEVVAPVLAVIVVMCVVLTIVQWSDRKNRSSLRILVLWLFVSIPAFAAGGNFFRHYWIIVMFPLGTMLGVLTSRVMGTRWFVASVIAALVMPLGLTAEALATPRDRIGPEIHGNSRLIADEEIARWFETRARPGDRIYALCASAGLYGQISPAPPFAYLWFDDIRQVPGAIDQLAGMLSGPRAPRFVARYQDPDLCDPTGRVRAALLDHYRRVAVVADREIYARL